MAVFESIFFIVILLFIILLATGLFFRSATIVMMAGALFMLLGLTLMGGDDLSRNTLDTVTISVVDANTTSLEFNYAISNTGNDIGLNILQYLFTYGGFTVVALGFAFIANDVMKAINAKKEEDEL